MSDKTFEADTLNAPESDNQTLVLDTMLSEYIEISRNIFMHCMRDFANHHPKKFIEVSEAITSGGFRPFLTIEFNPGFVKGWMVDKLDKSKKNVEIFRYEYIALKLN